MGNGVLLLRKLIHGIQVAKAVACSDKWIKIAVSKYMLSVTIYFLFSFSGLGCFLNSWAISSAILSLEVKKRVVAVLPTDTLFTYFLFLFFVFLSFFFIFLLYWFPLLL